MTDEQRALALWQGLDACYRLQPHITITVVAHWIEAHGAGYPDVALMQERIREDAALWAASASQVELEAYAAAAIMEMERTSITVRAAKRIAALGVRTMDAVSLDAFKGWIGKQYGQ